ncbi:MAG TPA: TatD family hydrolase [Methanocella sp.]|jgi:predicted metal-dependent TIM-barrel fold hydrolase|nr:TatD family hydrolase [Methanocella sp.]
MIDTHTHVDTRPYEDFEAMALAGITDILTLAHDPLKMSASIVFKDHFERLFAERERVEKNGPRLHVCLGIHPRVKPEDPDACLELLESYLRRNDRKVIALGETGLETGSPFEVGLLERQLELSIQYRLPIIIHTPRSNKASVTRDILGILSTFSIDKKEVVIDHADHSTIKPILDRGYNAGLTVQPSKLTSQQAAEIVKQHDAAMIVLNTDASSNPTDVLGVPRTVHLLRLNKVSDEKIGLVSELNAKRIFRLDQP